MLDTLKQGKHFGLMVGDFPYYLEVTAGVARDGVLTCTVINGNWTAHVDPTKRLFILRASTLRRAGLDRHAITGEKLLVKDEAQTIERYYIPGPADKPLPYDYNAACEVIRTCAIPFAQPIL